MKASWHGIVTVARQEFRLRIRAGRWRWLLLAWFVVLLAFTGLLTVTVGALGGSGQSPDTGPIVFGGLMLFLLGLALLVVPALTAQSVNGDRERGTLATLQVTLLTPWEIALGKLASAWLTALVFVTVALPCVGWAVALGGVSLDRLLVTLAVVVVLLGVVCAFGLALSALLTRSTTSSVLSYLMVFAMTVGTLVAFGLSLGLTTETRTVQQRVPVWDDPRGSGQGRPDWFETETFQMSEPRPDKVWWLLAPNPFVVLADAAPRSDDTASRFESVDPLGAIGDGVREVRRPPPPRIYNDAALQPTPPNPTGPVWPWGLAANVALGVGAVALTASRLRTPAGRLPRGMRVA